MVARNVPLSTAATALEVGRPAAGLLDQDHGAAASQRRQLDLDHRLGGALGDQRVAPEVAEAALAPGGAEEAAKPGARPDASMSRREP